MMHTAALLLLLLLLLLLHCAEALRRVPGSCAAAYLCCFTLEQLIRHQDDLMVLQVPAREQNPQQQERCRHTQSRSSMLQLWQV
jgi:hypothetical protein